MKMMLVVSFKAPLKNDDLFVLSFVCGSDVCCNAMHELSWYADFPNPKYCKYTYLLTLGLFLRCHGTLDPFGSLECCVYILSGEFVRLSAVWPGI